MIGLADIEAAKARIAGQVMRTPLVEPLVDGALAPAAALSGRAGPGKVVCVVSGPNSGGNSPPDGNSPVVFRQVFFRQAVILHQMATARRSARGERLRSGP